ncbi:V(D)J recombination-activating protein 1 isoform X2 [Tetranychus urticae]|uniref:V(D)J recombination-activating protein 1 isoform X2 n=1 Tax=Tetranychus urticae TaxID=32264 RepID=UPI00077BAEBF|nr:V(D)J recombination-activating protein 1 isoform X2 [Tetranychus urticae]
MGYDLKRFSDLGVLAEDITCPICMNVFRDPVTTKCRHTYCRDCLYEWLQRHKTCPLDQLPIESYDTLTKPPIFVINILGRLLIFCDYKEKGCQKTVKLEDLAQHVATCPFRPKTAVSQVLVNLTKLSNRLSFTNFASWLNRINQRARYRIRSRPRHTELARQRERRDEFGREEDITNVVFLFLALLAVAAYFAVLFRFAIECFLLFVFQHISILLFGVFVMIFNMTPQPSTVPLDYLLP